MATEVIIREQILVTLTCPTCGCLFAMPEHMRDALKKNHKDFWCPSGHSQGFYGKSELERERDRLASQVTGLRSDLEAEVRSHRSTKGKLTKERKRVANGVCPCCHRSFVNLGRHMASKHPDYGGDAS